jgi:predicted dehydrogenase
MQENTHIQVVCEPSQAAYAELCALFEAQGLTPPPNEPDIDCLLTLYGKSLNAAFIITPHVYHHDQAVACLEAGLDVLLEKPMVTTGEQAESLIVASQRVGRLLVVAFPGSLSPYVRSAVQMLRNGELGTVLTMSGISWENWRTPNLGTWRQIPEIAGGGFFFDTGAHMLNTLTDLAGEDFAEVAAWFDHRETPVEIMGVVMARLRSGAMVTMHACGDTCTRSTSEIRVFCSEGMLVTNIWGHHLSIQRRGDAQPEPVTLPPSLGVWQQFLSVRKGEMPNPCPPEVGLRMARLWDAIRLSASQRGIPVTIS